ncbi:D-alanyl-D-alanine carboxypeptidase, partial [bacterium]
NHIKHSSSSWIFLAFLLLSACVPGKARETSTPTVLPPTATLAPTATRTATAAATATAVLVTSSPQPILYVEPPALDLAAESAVLIDSRTGDVLFEKNAHQRMFPASTTKVMTALLALEYFDPDEMIWVGDEVNLAWTTFRLDAQKAGLLYSQEISMKELLYGLMLVSGSDAAFVIAANVARRESDDPFLPLGPAIERFCELMNQRARELGALESNFTSPDGYQDPNHYSSAYDLALIARAAMQDARFREIVGAAFYRPGESVSNTGTFSQVWTNTNRLLDQNDEHYYAPATGIKTGTTDEAGYCLISSADLDGQTYIAVALNSTQEGVWSDSTAMLEFARKDHSDQE